VTEFGRDIGLSKTLKVYGLEGGQQTEINAAKAGDETERLRFLYR